MGEGGRRAGPAGSSPPPAKVPASLSPGVRARCLELVISIACLCGAHGGIGPSLFKNRDQLQRRLSSKPSKLNSYVLSCSLIKWQERQKRH